MKSFYTKIVIFLGILGFFGCKDKPDYSIKPEITFQSIRKIITTQNGLKVDSIIVGLNFTDGDGDLGLSSSDLEDTIKYKGDLATNFHIDIYKKNKGVYQLVTTELSLDGVFPRLLSNNQVSPIDGLLTHHFKFIHALTEGNGLSSGDTVKFRIQIIDRSLQKSNLIETDPIIVLKSNCGSSVFPCEEL